MSGEVRINPTSSNYNNYDRNTNVTVGSGGVAKFFAICQYGLPYLVYEGLDGEADPSNTTFPASGGTMLYTLYSHYPWYFQSKPWWLTITDELGNTINEGSIQPALSGDCHCQFIRFTAMANTGATRNSGNFRLLHRLRGSEASEVVYIQFDQEAATSTPSITTPSDTNVPCTGGTVYLDILVPQGTPWHFANINSNFGLRFYDSAGTEFNYWQDVHSGTGVTERYTVVWPSYSGNEPRTCKPVLSMRVGSGPGYYDISPSFIFTQNPCASLTVTPNPIEFPPERQTIIYSAYTVDTTSDGSVSASIGSPYTPSANFYAALSGQYYAAGFNGSWGTFDKVTGVWVFNNGRDTLEVPVIKGVPPTLSGYSANTHYLHFYEDAIEIPYSSDYSMNEVVIDFSNYDRPTSPNKTVFLIIGNTIISPEWNGYVATINAPSGDGKIVINMREGITSESIFTVSHYYYYSISPNTRRTGAVFEVHQHQWTSDLMHSEPRIFEFPDNTYYGTTSEDVVISSDSSWTATTDSNHFQITPTTGGTGDTTVHITYNGQADEDTLDLGLITLTNGHSSPYNKLNILSFKGRTPLFNGHNQDFVIEANSDARNITLSVASDYWTNELQFYVTSGWSTLPTISTYIGEYTPTGSGSGYIGILPFAQCIGDIGELTISIPANTTGSERRMIINFFYYPSTDPETHYSGPSCTIIQAG